MALGSSCSRRPDPQTAFDHAWQTFQNGDLVHAQEEAKQGYEDFHSASTEWGWKFTILRARILHRQGRDDEALNLLDAKSGVPPQGELAIKRRWLQGLIHTHQHNFQSAEQDLSEAERGCGGFNYPSCEDVPQARGDLEMEQAHYPEAQVYFEETLTAARAGGSPFSEAAALLDLSHSAEEQAHFDEALDWADAARQISMARKFGGLAQKALGNMGWAYYKLGDYVKGEQATIEAWNEAMALGNRTDEVRWLTNAGLMDMDAGRLSDAQRAFERGLDLATQINAREDIINAEIALAFVSEQTGKLDDAVRFAGEALAKAREDKNARDEVYPRLVQGRIAARQNNVAAAAAAFNEVAQSQDSPVFLKWEAERSLARLYEDEGRFDSAKREYVSALTILETARSEVKHEDSRLPFLTNASRIYDDYVHFLVTRAKKDEALQVADFSRGRTLAEGLGLLKKETTFNPVALDAPGIARRAGGAVLFYWLGGKESYLWAITPRGTKLFTLPSRAEIDASVRRYREALAGPQEVLISADADGQFLFRTLISPVQPLLKKGARVVIIPEGSLNNLNFETLLVPESNASDSIPTSTQRAPKLHYWIEDATITDASSLRILGAPLAARRKRDRSLLLIGDSISPSDQYPELSHAADQMQSVARHFPLAAETVLARKDATSPAYLNSNPGRFSYIHFVAHGTASRLSPLDSAIVLSKAGPKDDSFKLYARDIILHPLRAELVTVSACYSAGERSYSGEGLVGLSWAFLRAGAHKVIAALWDASDAPTELLMDKFYDELNKGASPDVALRAAKLYLLHHEFHNPFYWAPFQLYSRLG